MLPLNRLSSVVQLSDSGMEGKFKLDLCHVLPFANYHQNPNCQTRNRTVPILPLF
jgi:hypothetical protein